MNWFDDDVIEYVPCDEAVRLLCDGVGCCATVVGGRSSKAVRRIARRAGWVQVGKRD